MHSLPPEKRKYYLQKYGNDKSKLLEADLELADRGAHALVSRRQQQQAQNQPPPPQAQQEQPQPKPIQALSTLTTTSAQDASSSSDGDADSSSSSSSNGDNDPIAPAVLNQPLPRPQSHKFPYSVLFRALQPNNGELSVPDPYCNHKHFEMPKFEIEGFREKYVFVNIFVYFCLYLFMY